MLINLKSPVYEVMFIYRKSSAIFFKDLKVGDRIQFNNVMQDVWAGNKSYASQYAVKNLETGDIHVKTQSMMVKCLEAFQLSEV